MSFMDDWRNPDWQAGFQKGIWQVYAVGLPLAALAIWWWA